LAVYANITSEVSAGTTDRDRGVPGASGHSERDVDWVGNSLLSPSRVLVGEESPVQGNAKRVFSQFNAATSSPPGGGAPVDGSSPVPRVNSSGSLSATSGGSPLPPGSPLGATSWGERSPLLFAGGESPHGSGSPHLTPRSRSRSESPEDAEEFGGTPRWVRKAQESTGGKFTFGFLLASVAGVFYGTNFNPPQRLIDSAVLKANAEHSKHALDYVFSHFCGIFFATFVYFIIYCALKHGKGRKPQLPPCVLPAFCSGLMWGVAQICFFVANERLSFSVSFPIVTSVPGYVLRLRFPNPDTLFTAPL